MRRYVVQIFTIGAGLMLAATAHAQQALTPQDRADIQDLSARYAHALGACDAEAYAGLFAPDSGYFASNIRGEVTGRERLVALVRSERHCQRPATGAAPAPAAPATPRPVPTVTIATTNGAVTGVADLGGAGRYEDEYVKTSAGWRFTSRTVMTPAEIKAGLDARDTWTIRRLAGSDLGGFDDVYVATGDGGEKRFRASGVALGLTADGVTGRAYLRNDPGHYEDVYVRAANGSWRFKSRTYVVDDPPVARRPQ